MNHTPLLFKDLTDQQQQHKQRLMVVLRKYLPGHTVEYCSELIMYHKLHLHIEVERKDRLGDYSAHLGQGNRISINHNLNPYDFLITFVHELAHHTTHKKFGSRHAPHGDEWKEEFKNCMRPFVVMNVFPPDINMPLIRHMQKPKYTHSGDVNLVKALMKYDRNPTYTILEQLKEGDHFKMSARGKVVLKKGQKRRTYYDCQCIHTNRKYMVHVIAKVVPVPMA